MYYDYDRSHRVISYVFHNILRKCMRLSGLCESSQLMPCDIPFLQDSLEEQLPLRAIFPAQSHVRSLLKSSSPWPSFSRKLLSLVSLSLELAIWEVRCLHWIIRSCLSMTRSIAHSFIASNIVSVLWIEAAISLCASAPPKPLSMTHFSAFSKCITTLEITDSSCWLYRVCSCRHREFLLNYGVDWFYHLMMILTYHPH